MSDLLNDNERQKLRNAWREDPFRILAQDTANAIYRATFEPPVGGDYGEPEFAISLLVAEHEDEDDPEPFLADFEEKIIDGEGKRHQSMTPRG